VDPGFEDPLEVFNVLWYAAAANVISHVAEERLKLVDPGLIEISAAGARYPVLEYLEAAGRRTELAARMNLFHQTYDLLLSPTVPIPAFEAGREVPEGWPERRWTSWTPFTYPFNLTQQPAASVPCSLTGSGLPIGLQIVGARHRDALVLRAAHAYQQAKPLPARAPG
jgi:aspartyl-tRNA(Asn)/glutamyl-tRNA(Gln) amidotransferase subunit A